MVRSMYLVLFFYNHLPTTKKFLSILAFKCYDGIVQEDGPEVIKSLEEKTCGVTIVDCIKYSGYIKRVHIIKATQNTRLKATPKNTGKKATKMYRNIGYNEYTGLKATAFLNTQEKRLHFLNTQEKRLHFSNIQEKGYTS